MTPGCGMGTSKAAGTMQTAGKVVRYCKCVWPNRRWLKVDSSLCHGVLSKGERRKAARAVRKENGQKRNKEDVVGSSSRKKNKNV